MLAKPVGGSGSVANPLEADLNFATYKAVAMACDNGATLPTSPTPVVGQWFLHTPTGRSILMQYSGTVWIPIYAFGATTMYVSTTGTDDAAHGTATGTDAFLTLTYALSMVPPLCSGNVIIYAGVGTFAEDVVVQGKLCTGPYTLTIQGTLTSLLTASMDSGVQGSGATVGSVTDTGAFAATVYTTVDATSAAAQKVLNVTSTTGFAVGDTILINSGGARQELATVKTITDGVALNLVYNLQYEHTGVQADAVAQCQYAGKQIEVGTDIRVIDYHTANTVYIAGYFSAEISGTYTIYDYGTVVGLSATFSVYVNQPNMPVYFRQIKITGQTLHYSFTLACYHNCEFDGGYVNATVYSYVEVYYCYANDCCLLYQGAGGKIYSNKLKAIVGTGNRGMYLYSGGLVFVRNMNTVSGWNQGVSISDGTICSGSYTGIRCCTTGASATNAGQLKNLSLFTFTNCATNSTVDAATFALST